MSSARDVDLASVAELSARLARVEELDPMLDVVLGSLRELWGFEHSILLLREEGSDRLVTLATHGYSRAGVGSEVELGVGTIGVAAQQRAPVRIGNLQHALRYARAARVSLDEREAAARREIPLPGLRDVNSQLAVPLLACGQLVGALCVESRGGVAFDERAEQALTIAANQIAASLVLVMPESPRVVEVPVAAPEPVAIPEVVQVRYYAEDSSIFLDGDYLIKSLPGRILWALLQQYQSEGRRDFTNKELRLDASLGLPPVKDNLETRLILLRRRLEERSEAIRMERTGRGRFRLVVTRGLSLARVD